MKTIWGFLFFLFACACIYLLMRHNPVATPDPFAPPIDISILEKKYSITKDNYKLTMAFSDERGYLLLLCDLQADPNCQKSISASKSNVVKTMWPELEKAIQPDVDNKQAIPLVLSDIEGTPAVIPALHKVEDKSLTQIQRYLLAINVYYLVKDKDLALFYMNELMRNPLDRNLSDKIFITMKKWCEQGLRVLIAKQWPTGNKMLPEFPQESAKKLQECLASY